MSTREEGGEEGGRGVGGDCREDSACPQDVQTPLLIYYCPQGSHDLDMTPYDIYSKCFMEKSPSWDFSCFRVQGLI
jgi:hypothetical protein